MYHEEIDHCRRLKVAYWKVGYYPDTSGLHLAGGSAKSTAVLSKARQICTMQVECEQIYTRKHHGSMGLAFLMALLGLGDAIVVLKQILKRLLWRSAATQGKVLLSSTLQVLKITTWITQATRLWQIFLIAAKPISIQ